MLILLNYIYFYLIIYVIKVTNSHPTIGPTKREEEKNFEIISSTNDSIVLCNDGRGPLLEGDGIIYSCNEKCPAGFDCEFFSYGYSKSEGICCPNLKELYNLYSEEASNLDEASESIVQSESDNLNPELGIVSYNQENEAIHLRSRDEDLRRKQANKGIHSIAGTGESFSCHRQQLELYCENGNRQTQFVMRWYYREGQCLPYPWGYCPGEPVSADPTLRTEEECQLLCIKPIDNLAEIELNLQSNVSSIEVNESANLVEFKRDDIINDQSQLFHNIQNGKNKNALKKVSKKQQKGFVNNVNIGLSTRMNEESTTSASTKINTTNNKIGSELIMTANNLTIFKPSSLRSIVSENSTVYDDNEMNASRESEDDGKFTFHEAVDERQKKKKKCEKVTPYRAMCDSSEMPSQFTLRWYLRGNKCELYPYGYCHGEAVQNEEPIMSEEECVALCIIKKSSLKSSLKRSP